ncbi:4-fold beta flower protein [Ferruginivarius sediminum]|uniref:4-fold beta flower protein n=1 Tax=Ferruginivarius sediminum TaxID=2661937 RepID=UPI003BAB7F0D
MNTLYNSFGKAVAYIDDDQESVFLYSGKPVAWLSGHDVFSYSGRYVGWCQDGWFYDRSGKPAFFTDNARGGPAKPARAARPARGARGARPARGAREARPARPARSLSWSPVSNEQYFSQ